MKEQPRVSILIPTYNRSAYLPDAIASALTQDFADVEVVVVRDGGSPIDDIIESFGDERIVFVNRDQNRGIPFTLNQGLAAAGGEYICYLGDDDILYPNHVSTLLDAIENQIDCDAVYSDLYRVYCRNEADGSRTVLSKVVEVSRDFDRLVMLYFNHTLHVSMMHRKSLVEKTGLYNEDLNILVDWDLFRRMVFFTDFYHVNKITGEYYTPVANSDRVSVKHRKDPQKYLRNAMTIRTTRPTKPWAKLDDLAIVIDCDNLTQKTGQVVKKIWETTVVPNRIFLPLRHSDIAKLDISLPNIVPVEVADSAATAAKIAKVLENTDAEYIAVIPEEFKIEQFWAEDCFSAIARRPMQNEVFEIEGSSQQLWAGVFEAALLKELVLNSDSNSLLGLISQSGLNIRKLQPREISFQYDQLLSRANNLMDSGNYAEAAEMFEKIADNYGNRFWINGLAANAYLKSGNWPKAKIICRRLNSVFATAESIITEAKAEKCGGNHSRAAKLFASALEIIEGKQLVWA